MADGNPAGVESLKGMQTNEFYYFYKTWKRRQEAIANRLTKKK